MKKLFLYLSLLLSVALNTSAQIGVVSTVGNYKQNVSITEPLSDSTTEFTNDNIHKVARSGISTTGYITTPTGYNIVNWAITDHCTRDTIATGSTKTVTNTFVFESLDSCITYDIHAVVSNGIQSFPHLWEFEYTVLPQKPTEYDLEISAATFQSVTWVSRPGYAIRIHGDINSGTVDLRKFKSDDPTQPVHIVLDDVDITSTTWNLKLQMLKNVIVDGCTDNSIQYGGRLYKADGGINQMLVFDWNGSGATEKYYFSKNVVICGIYADGRYVAGNGNTAYRILPGTNDADVNNATDSLSGLVTFNLYARRCHEENYYYGYFGDADFSAGLTRTQISGALIYRCHSYDAGLDAWQFTGRHSEIAYCIMKQAGYRGDINHENVMQIGSSKNVWFYRNWVEQNSLHNTFFLANGSYGGFCQIFSNVFVSTVGPGNAGNIWIRADLSNVYSTIWQNFYNNTVYAADYFAFRLYEATATDFNKLNVLNNVVIAEDLTDYNNASGVNAANVSFNNYKQTLASISSVGFVNAPTNFKYTTSSSPVFNTTATVPNAVWRSEYDYEGSKFFTPTRGAYSGYELTTLE